MRLLLLITLMMLISKIKNVNGMVFFDGNYHLDYLYQKSLRYQHHRENYVTSLLEGFIPKGLRIKKCPAFEPVTDHFESQWNSILYDTEKRLVELLLKESENVIAKIDNEIEIELQKGGESSQEGKRDELEQRNVELKNHLQHRRVKKWNRIKEELYKENKTKENVTSASEQKEGAIRDDDPEKNQTVSLLKESQKNNPNLINETLVCNLENDLFVDNVTDNRRYRKKTSRSYAEVVSGTPDAKKVKMKNTNKNEVPHNKKEGIINLESIFEDLLRDNVSIRQETLSPPNICTNSSLSDNNFSNVSGASENLDDQDFEILNILEDLLKSSDDTEKQVKSVERKNNYSIQIKTSITTDESRLSGYFCSETVFNLSNRVLSDAEIRVLGKGLDYAPIQRKMNEPELIHDFNDFCRRMRLKWHFRDEPNTFSETPAFRPKSTWVPPKGHPCLKVFLSQVEAELFKLSGSSIRYSNMSKDEWDAIRSLADDRRIVIKRADKGSCVVIWDRKDYLLEAEKQLKNKNVYRDVEYNVNVLKDLAEKCSVVLEKEVSLLKNNLNILHMSTAKLLA